MTRKRVRAPRPIGSLTDRAQSAIREGILSLRFLPGQSLNEAQLALELHMSKTPVREALQRLASEELVTLDRFRGAMVREVGPELIRNIYEVREVLEPVAVLQAVPRLMTDGLAELEAILRQSASALDDADLAAFGRSNRAFHGRLISSATNDYLKGILERIQDLVRVVSMITWVTVDSRRGEHQEHLDILAAARRRDAEKASSLMAQHIANFRELALRAAESRYAGRAVRAG